MSDQYTYKGYTREQMEQMVASGEKIRQSKLSQEAQTAAMLKMVSESSKSPAGGVRNYLLAIEEYVQKVILGRISQVGRELSKYKKGEHDQDDELALDDEYYRIISEVKRINGYVGEIQEKLINNKTTMKDVEGVEKAWRDLQMQGDNLEVLSADIKNKSTNLNKIKLKLQRAKNTARRLCWPRVGSVILTAGVVAQLLTSTVMGFKAHANKEYFKNKYEPGQTISDITEGYRGDLERVFEVMTKEELAYENNDVQDEQYQNFSQDFAEILSVVDEYVLLENTPESKRTNEQARRLRELETKIDDYKGYIDTEGNALGFNETMKMMIMSKLADSIKRAKCEVELDNIVLRMYEASDGVPEYAGFYAKYKDNNGEEHERRVTDETFFLLAHEGFLNVEIASLAPYIEKLGNSSLSVSKKAEILQVVAAAVDQEIIFDPENGRFTMGEEREQPVIYESIDPVIVTEIDDGER